MIATPNIDLERIFLVATANNIDIIDRFPHAGMVGHPYSVGLMMQNILKNIRISWPFGKKNSPKDVLTREMLEELRRLRLIEEKQMTEIKKLKSEIVLVKTRRNYHLEHMKAFYVREFSKKLHEIRQNNGLISRGENSQATAG